LRFRRILDKLNNLLMARDSTTSSYLSLVMIISPKTPKASL